MTDNGSVFAHVDGLVGPEPLELPVGSATAFLIVGAKALALLHDEVAIKLTIPMIDQHKMRATRDRLAALDRLHGLGRRHDVLSDVSARDCRVVHQLVEVGKLDAIAFGMDLPTHERNCAGGQSA
jgi:hypothetical protein